MSSRAPHNYSTNFGGQGHSLASKLTSSLVSGLLHLYESSHLYDCTFKVGFLKRDAFKIFKCHRAILAASSEFFSRTFSGKFKEARMQPDEPILLDRVKPEVFDFAMRFVYARSLSLPDGDIYFAVDVYKFAHEMQIPSLMEPLEILFTRVPAAQVMAVYDVLKLLGDKNGLLAHCKQLIAAQTEVVLKSTCWLNASQDSVLEVIKIKRLSSVSQFTLAKALIKWGKFRVFYGGGILKETLGPCCDWVKTLDFYPEEFAQLCRMGLDSVLSDKEKCDIFMKLSLRQKPPAKLDERALIAILHERFKSRAISGTLKPS